MAQSGGDKTEKATPKKREDARKKGQVAKSQDLNGAVVMLAGLMALSAAGSAIAGRMQDAMRDTLTAFVGIFAAAIQVAGPVLLALILTDAAFGMVSRVVPQLNVFAVGFAAKVVVGIGLLAVTMPFLSGWLGDELERSVSEALRMLKVA